MTPPFETTEEPGEPGAESKRSNAPEPTPAQITRAVAFLREALKDGPRLTREVEAEAKRAGHAHRTLVRARSELHVKKLPPEVARGAWRIALENDPAVAAYKQRKETKTKQARQRQGNGRKRRARTNNKRKAGEPAGLAR